MVLAVASSALRRILWDAISADPVTSAIVGTEEAIVFVNPTETARDSANRLSMWLYQLSENEYTKNAPPIRLDDAHQQLPPLTLDLYYLLTPFAGSGEGDLLLLGRAMQALYDRATTILRNPGADVAEELRIILYRRSLEELTRVWEALREPYRLSVCYQVRITRLDSTRITSNQPVVEIDAGYPRGQLVTL
jgi:hypothetical protein